MKIGGLRHKITIEKPVTAKNSLAAMTTTWVQFAQVWASIETLRGFDKTAAQANYPGANAKVVIRYISGLLPTMRLVYNNQIYSILGAPNNVDMRNRVIELTCETGVKSI
jgi:SPP1 family predicted phage head-tail adaptor